MMDQSKMMSSEEKENLAGQVMESLGEPEVAAEQVNEEPQAENVKHVDPIQERLARQATRHKKEMRDMQAKLDALHQQFSQPQQQSHNYQPEMGEPGSEDERIQRAVHMALRAKEDQERQAKEAERMAHVQKQYANLQDHLDNASNQYEDFDEVVRSHDAPYTDAMRDAALLIPNAADVLYKLGKNRDELKRISALHPIDQAKEMVKMSVALMGGNNGKSQAPRPIGQIKSNPVTSHGAVTENTPVSELRRRMKAGWKV